MTPTSDPNAVMTDFEKAALNSLAKVYILTQSLPVFFSNYVKRIVSNREFSLEQPIYNQFTYFNFQFYFCFCFFFNQIDKHESSLEQTTDAKWRVFLESKARTVSLSNMTVESRLDGAFCDVSKRVKPEKGNRNHAEIHATFPHRRGNNCIQPRKGIFYREPRTPSKTSIMDMLRKFPLVYLLRFQ